MIKIIANGFGVLSTICFIISFQIKSNKGLFITQSIANVFYGLQFLLLGATGGLFNMFMQIVRNMLLLKIENNLLLFAGGGAVLSTFSRLLRLQSELWLSGPTAPRCSVFLKLSVFRLPGSYTTS